VQKLKKKAHLLADDPVLVFYSFGENAHNCKQAI